MQFGRGALALGVFLTLLPLTASANESDGVDVAGVQAATRQFHCADWGASGCLTSDYTFDVELVELGNTSTGRPLLESAARSGLTIEAVEPNLRGINAAFAPSDNTIRLSRSVKSYPLPDRLAIVAHELQHAADAASGLAILTASGCYGTERNAVATEARLWAELFEEALPAPRTAYEAWLNHASRSPMGMPDLVQSAYQAECDHVSPSA